MWGCGRQGFVTGAAAKGLGVAFEVDRDADEPEEGGDHGEHCDGDAVELRFGEVEADRFLRFFGDVVELTASGNPVHDGGHDFIAGQATSDSSVAEEG